MLCGIKMNDNPYGIINLNFTLELIEDQSQQSEKQNRRRYYNKWMPDLEIRERGTIPASTETERIYESKKRPQIAEASTKINPFIIKS